MNDSVEENIAQDKKKALSQKKDAEGQKKKKKLKIVGGVLLALALFLWWGLQPLKAGMVYGLCRSYLETELRYPTTYKIVQYDEYGTSMRLFYTYVDEYGGHRADMIECIAQPDPVNGYVVGDIKINRESIGPEKVALFNKAIPGIIAANPDLRIPKYRGDDLQSLKRD